MGRREGSRRHRPQSKEEDIAKFINPGLMKTSRRNVLRGSMLAGAAALTGAVFLIGADIVSRIIIPGQVLPIGVVTALIGAPAFAIILVRGQRTAR